MTAPGFGGVTEIGLPSVAERLATAGIAVLAFVDVGFGESDGEPRQHFDPLAQVDQFRPAIAGGSWSCGGKPADGRLVQIATSVNGGRMSLDVVVKSP